MLVEIVDGIDFFVVCDVMVNVFECGRVGEGLYVIEF